MFFSNLSGKNKPKPNSVIFALNSELHHSTCRTISAVGTRITPSGGRCRHSCHGRICWHQSGCSWREPANMGKGSRVRFENSQPKEYLFFGEGTNPKNNYRGMRLHWLVSPSLQALNLLITSKFGPCKAAALTRSGTA